MSGWNVGPPAVFLLSLLSAASGLSTQPQNAALHVTLDQTACRAVDEIGAYQVTTRPEPSISGWNTDKKLIGHSDVTTDCAWTIEDLMPGEYEVWFQREGAKVAVRALPVASGQTADVGLTADVVVTGAVILNGVPFEGVTVEFTQKHGDRRQLASSLTNAAGTYQVFLADEEPYSVEFTRDRTIVLGQGQQGTARRGNNRMDWLLEGGTLKVMPIGWDRKQRIELLIERKGQRTGMIGVGVLVEADHLPLTLEGLGYGTYQMRWMDGEKGGVVSTTVEVALDSQERERSLQLAVGGPRF